MSIALLGSGAGAQQDPPLDPAALATLRRMAEQLRSLPGLRAEVEVEYDALQRDGQTIEFGSTREVALRRPDRMRADATDRSGAKRSLYYDGHQVAVVDHANAVYATAAQAGGVDAVLRFAEEQLGIVVGGGVKAYGELSGSAKIEGTAKRTTDEVARQLRPRFEQQGWIAPSAND
jgi:hypothetical protein